MISIDADQPTPVRVEVLGDLRLLVEGQEVEVPGPKRRALLALLAKAEGRAVAVDHLLDALWPSGPPAGARAALHTHVSRLRGHLGTAADRLQATGGGYRLEVEDGALDAARARALLAQARRLADEDPPAAYAVLREASALWRGPVLADLGDVPPVAAWTVALEELRRETNDGMVRCALVAGHVGQAVKTAAESAVEDPLREPAALLLMRSLAAAGRAAEALRVGYAFRERLREEAGLDPSEALGRLEREIASSHADGPTARAVAGATGNRQHLLGRQGELAGLRRLVADEQVVTVVGPAGVGKTSLALAVTREHVLTTVIPLAAAGDVAEIPPILAEALDLRVTRGDVLTACLALLRAGPRLLVLDNCEHLLDAVRDLVTAITATCPDVTILATSREPLRVAGERQCRLDPLPVPDRHTADVSRLPSVQLFIDRARRVRPSFDPEPDDLRRIGDVVRRLDGLPFAIELAAGRLSAFGLVDLHARLDRALDVLGDAATTDARHRTLRATIQWSAALLSEDEGRLYRHLAVFPHGVGLATAERVAARLSLNTDPASALARLVDTSMVEADFGQQPRYRMLETMRAFALDQLRSLGESDAAWEQLVHWAVELATWVDASARSEDEPDADITLRTEAGNLRAAWQRIRADDRIDDAIEIVVHLADASAWRDFSEIWGWAQELADDHRLTEHPRAAAALGAAAQTAWLQGDTQRSQRLASQGLELATSTDDRHRCHSTLAVLSLFEGDAPTAIEHALEAATVAPHPSEDLGVAALAAAYAGDLDQARTLRDRLQDVAVQPSLHAFAAYVAAEVAITDGDTGQAEEHYTRAVELARQSGATFVNGIAAVGLMTLRADTVPLHEALRGYRELIDYWEHTGSWIQQWTTLRNLATLLATLGEAETALFLYAAADAAPDAPALHNSPAKDRHQWSTLPDRTVARLLAEAASSHRSQVLEFARAAIDPRVPPG